MAQQSFSSDSSVGRIAKNGVFIASQFGIYTLAGFFFIPFLVRQYGAGLYGLIALAGFLTQYVGLISHCVGNSIARYLNVSLNRDSGDEANEIFSTALVANAGFILVQIPFFALGIWKLHWLIDFPKEVAGDFRILVVCNVLVFFTSIIAGVFRTPIQAANRLDIISTIDTVRMSLRLLLLYLLIKNIGAKLWIIGMVDLSLALLNFILLTHLYRKMARHLNFGWRYVTRKWVRPVMNMAGWSIMTTLGGYLLVRTDVWMINRFVGKEMAGIYAAILVWPNFLKQVSKRLATVLAPVYLIDYAKGNSDRVARVGLSAAKLLGCMVALVAGTLFVFAEPLLSLWLGSASHIHATLLRIMIVYLAYTIGENVLWQIFVALNKVHFTGVVNLCAGIVNIVLSIVLIIMGYGAVGVAIASAVAMLLASAVAIPYGVCHALHVPYRAVIWNYVYATLLMLLSSGAAIAALRLADTSYMLSGAVFSVILSAGLLLSYRVMLSDYERTLIHRFVKRAFQLLRSR